VIGRSVIHSAGTGFLLASLLLGSSFGSAPALAGDDSGAPGVARVSVLSGDVEFDRADSDAPLAAALNAPVLPGDALTTGDDSRSEVELDSNTVLRLAPDTQVRFARLDAGGSTFQLAAGTAELALLHQAAVPSEIDTPSVAVQLQGAGDYRVSVSDLGASEITVRRGQAAVLLPAGTQNLTTAGSMVLQGAPSNPQIQYVAPPAFDGFDRWNADRDRQLAAALSTQYAGAGVAGASDLDPYGSWVDQAGYGNVWVPAVAPGWAPYRDGRWVWEPYYGWTWVADEPWGWAPYHYGRWFYAAGTGWCWYPGAVAVRPVWQPALVAFVGLGGGFNFSLGFGNVGWVPLAPFEPFHPWWGRHNANLTNDYHYRNLLVNHAVTAVPAQDFAAGRFNRRLAVEPGALRAATFVSGPLPIVPSAQNLRLSERKPAQLAAPDLVQRRFRAFTAPAHQAEPFEQQRASIQRVTERLYPGLTTTHENPSPQTLHEGPANPQTMHDTLTPQTARGSVSNDPASTDTLERGNRHAIQTSPPVLQQIHPAAIEPHVITPASHAYVKPKVFVAPAPRATHRHAAERDAKDRDER
jgi:hypothetical protein